MNYCLYKLKFSTPLHAGSGDSARSLESSCATLCADTLFSALCHASLSFGAQSAEKLCRMAKDGEFLLSDAMPYCGDSLYIPKPYARSRAESSEEVSAEDRKAMKKLSHIPVATLGDFFSSLRGDSRYDAAANRAAFGRSYITTKNVIARCDPSEENSVMPYSVGLFEFDEKCGLYFIAAQKDEDADFVSAIVARLGLCGVGGKISSGYGKFTLADDPLFLDAPYDNDTEILSAMLYEKSAKLYISITTSLPRDDELDEALVGASYGVSRRGGFAFSENLEGGAVKKRTQYFLSAGSVFERKYRGDLYDVAQTASHPVYRYGAPIFLGAPRP